MMASAIIECPIGPLLAIATATGLRRLTFVDGIEFAQPDESPAGQTADAPALGIIQETERQLGEYFLGLRRNFDLPLEPEGTSFQLNVWRAIAAIPYGEVMSYAEVAAAAGFPGAFRAAGTACGANRLAIVIPCHRVIAAGRRIGGYGGSLPVKRRLLDLEGSLAHLRDAQAAALF